MSKNQRNQNQNNLINIENEIKNLCKQNCNIAEIIKQNKCFLDQENLIKLFKEDNIKCIKLLYISFIKNKQQSDIQVSLIYDYSKIIKQYVNFVLSKKLLKLSDLLEKKLFLDSIDHIVKTTNNLYTKNFVSNTIKIFLEYIYDIEIQLVIYQKDKSVSEYNEYIKKIKKYEIFLQDIQITTLKVNSRLYSFKDSLVPTLCVGTHIICIVNIQVKINIYLRDYE